MAKRKANDSYDDPIGLTQAFAPVPSSDDPYSGSPSLTGAFGPVVDVEETNWDTSDKWQGFDWNAASGDDDLFGENEDEQALAGEQEEASGVSDVEAEELAGTDEPRSRGRHAAHAAHAAQGEGPSGDADADLSADEAIGEPDAAAVPATAVSERMRRSKRTRTALIVVIVLLFVLLGALGFFIYNLYSESQTLAAQQTQEQTATDDLTIKQDAGLDEKPVATKTTDVPSLVALLGMTRDEAVTSLERGALVTSTRAVDEEGSPIKQSVTVALTKEPTVSRTGSPTVYLGLNADGKIIQAGYSAPASLLGFGSLSFKDAVNDEHVVEKTLQEAGVNVQYGVAQLPVDRAQYTTYATDGKTVVRERCPFSGDVTVNGSPCTWSAVLSYDYTAMNLSGNMNDTVRIIYAYITMK